MVQSSNLIKICAKNRTPFSASPHVLRYYLVSIAVISSTRLIAAADVPLFHPLCFILFPVTVSRYENELGPS